MPINQKFGDAIKNRLEAEGLSQRELARRTGVSQTTISMIIAGKQMPNLEFALEIARALKISIDSLLTDEDTPQEDDSTQLALAM